MSSGPPLTRYTTVTRLRPAGSNFFHTFYLNGSEVHEIYKVNADRTVSIVSRSMTND